MNREVLISFANEEQAKVFFDYFKESGFDDLTSNDHVHDDLPSENWFSEPIYQEPKSKSGYYQIKIADTE